MKKLLLVTIVLALFSNASFSQKDTTKKDPGANIKQFWLVVLKTGPKDKEIKDSTERSNLFKGHFANMERLYNDGVLKIAGPFGKNDFTWRGLFILDCKTKDEAEGFVKTDPTVIAGVFIYDIVPWFAEPSGSLVPGKPKKE
ncbi:MAG TPA: YciI family protein [Chitinophagaceae bacterium]